MEQDGEKSAKYSVERYAETGRNGSHTLKTPIPVHIDYYVVRVHDDGRVHFGADIYRYDRPRVDARVAELLQERGEVADSSDASTGE